MDYYGKFREEAIALTKDIVKERDELDKIIAFAKKNLAKEQEVVLKLKSRIAKMEELADVSLTDDTLSFDKFKTRQKKINTELQTAEKACELLRDKIIPKKTAELQAVRIKLKGVLNAFYLRCEPVNKEQVRSILYSAAAEKATYVTDFGRIYKAVGCGVRPAFSAQKILHKAYSIFKVSPRISQPKQPEPQEQAVSEQVDKPATSSLTGEKRVAK